MGGVLTETCRLKASLFALCGSGSIACCQYCARQFCPRHGVVLDDGQEICFRKECVAKRKDLARHLVYKEQVRARNEDRLCGLDACVTAISQQCVRCKGLFCAVHVHRREELVMEATVRVPRMATLCRHCSNRRAVWLRQ